MSADKFKNFQTVLKLSALVVTHLRSFFKLVSLFNLEGILDETEEINFSNKSSQSCRFYLYRSKRIFPPNVIRKLCDGIRTIEKGSCES